MLLLLLCRTFEIGTLLLDIYYFTELLFNYMCFTCSHPIELGNSQMELRSPALSDLPLRGSPMLPRPTLVIGIRHELENPQRAMGHHGTGPPFDSLQLPEKSSWMNFGLWMFMVDTTNYFMGVINQLRTGGQHPVGPGQSVWPFLNGLAQVPKNDVVFVCFFVLHLKTQGGRSL